MGASAAGLHLLLHPDVHVESSLRTPLLRAHHRPVPQLALGRLLGEGRLASACIDVSDGVIQDLGHICAASGVGARLDLDALPLVPPVRALARQLGLDPLEWGARGGEDYVLLFTVPAEREAELLRRCQEQLPTPPIRVGCMVSGSAVQVKRGGGWVPAGAGGYDHFAP